MRRFQRVLAIAAVVMASATGVLLHPSPASAALPYCNDVTGVTADTGNVARYESYSDASGYHTFDCDMNWLNENGNAGQRKAIKQIQWDLIQCYGATISYDGEYGPGTKAAVKSLQRALNTLYAAGLAEDGWAGPNTRKAMRHVVWDGASCAYTHNPSIDWQTWYHMSVPDHL